MENIFIFAFLVTVLYLIMKLLEMKFVYQEMKPLKDLARDVCMVFSASTAAAFISLRYQSSVYDFFNVMTKTKVLNNDQTQVFTGEPGF